MFDKQNCQTEFFAQTFNKVREIEGFGGKCSSDFEATLESIRQILGSDICLRTFETNEVQQIQSFLTRVRFLFDCSWVPYDLAHQTRMESNMFTNQHVFNGAHIGKQ